MTRLNFTESRNLTTLDETYSNFGEGNTPRFLYRLDAVGSRQHKFKTYKTTRAYIRAWSIGHSTRKYKNTPRSFAALRRPSAINTLQNRFIKIKLGYVTCPVPPPGSATKGGTLVKILPFKSTTLRLRILSFFSISLYLTYS